MLNSSTISNNTGGFGAGIYNGAGNTTTITNSTLSGNTTSASGGAIRNRGTLTIINSTISGNSAATDGGGIASGDGIVSLSFVTVFNNRADADGVGGGNGGGFYQNGGTFTYRNTIITGDLVGTGTTASDCVGTFASSGVNVVGSSGSAQGCNGAGGTNLINGGTPSAVINALGNNGGLTQTHSLSPSSLALNQISAAQCTTIAGSAVTTDQRGFMRPYPVGGNCDIGAFEAQPNAPPTSVSAGGAYTISEGDSLTLSGSATDQEGDPLTYSWDVNGDGVFGDATGANPTLTWAQLNALGINDGPATINNVKVRVSDGINPAVDSGATSITVNNTVPIVVISGAPTNVAGSPYTLNLSSNDPGNDTISGWAINWGDGSPVQNVSGNPPNVVHIYNSAGNYNITAAATDEDGTYPASNSVSVSVSPACPVNPVVTNANDSGAGSLRQAVINACAGDTITFDANGVFASPQTITLTTGEIGINKNLTINGTGANLLSISGGGVSRVFNISQAGVTVTLNDLTVTRGSADNGGGISNSGAVVNLNGVAVSGNAAVAIGGGIFNAGGTVNLTASTVSGNTSSTGGGIANGGVPSVLNVTNSTISGNSADNGGGIFTNGAVTVRSSTVTANRASGQGGGIANFTFEAVSLGNTIVAGNTAQTAPDFRDALNSLGYNLIGNTSSASITGDTTGNILNSDARLLPLADYGGTTQTHALAPDSPAINAGTADDASIFDQRGKARVGATDIGSFEASANLVVTNTNDSGAGSLRDAIAAANATTADESISFAIPQTDPGCVNGVCTITLTSGQLMIDSAVSAGALLIYNATGARNLRISGNNQSRVIDTNGSADLTLSGVTITDGSVNEILGGGGIRNRGTLTVIGSLITGNSSDSNVGGGISSTYGTRLTVINSTISGNFASNGGGIYIDFATATVINSTISGNSVPSGASGGGIHSFGATSLINSTISGNSVGMFGSGGGLSAGSGEISLLNTIVAGNTSPSSGPDIFGIVNSLGYNLIGNTSGANIQGNTTGNILNQPARLAPLGYYGGTTPTHPLLSNSPAINAGTATGAPLSDQRGAARVGQTDIGAFELNNSQNGGNYRVVLPIGRRGSFYDYLITPNNGAFNYTVTSGALPDGISVNTNFAPNAVVSISGNPLQTGIFDFSLTASDGADSNVTDYSLQILVPTAAGVSVSGRVLTNGSGLMNAIVTMTDQNGNVRSYRTNSFGYFYFDSVGVGQTYIFQVNSKRFTFAPQIVTVNDKLEKLEFIAQE